MSNEHLSEGSDYLAQCRAHLQASVLEAFGLKPHDIGAAPVPWHVRIWRAVTFAYRRGKAVDWRSYDEAEAEYRARDEAYRASLPGRAQDVADHLSGLLPDRMRFEWSPEERGGNAADRD